MLGGTAALLAVAGVGISLIETGLDISGEPKPLASSLDLAPAEKGRQQAAKSSQR